MRLLIYKKGGVLYLIKDFEDFIFDNQSFHSLFAKYIINDYDHSNEYPLSLDNSMELGEINNYRDMPNCTGSTWSSQLEISIRIVKNPCVYLTNKSKELTESDIRELSRWIFASRYPKWITFVYRTRDNIRCFGKFVDLAPYVIANSVYGLEMKFQCVNNLAYTEEMSNSITVTKNYGEFLVENNTDRIDSYFYPKIAFNELEPKSDVLLCNLSDTTIYRYIK